VSGPWGPLRAVRGVRAAACSCAEERSAVFFNKRAASVQLLRCMPNPCDCAPITPVLLRNRLPPGVEGAQHEVLNFWCVPRATEVMPRSLWSHRLLSQRHASLSTRLLQLLSRSPCFPCHNPTAAARQRQQLPGAVKPPSCGKRSNRGNPDSRIWVVLGALHLRNPGPPQAAGGAHQPVPRHGGHDSVPILL
jgi:hypothetical protein